MADSNKPKIEVRFYESLGVVPLKNEGMWTTGVETFEEKPEGYEAVTDFNDLDDPYLELFDRVNQLEMDIKELSAKFDKYIDVILQQRAYDKWVLQGMPVGGAGTGDGGTKNIHFQQSEFKFFE